jgi:hypothetical protein
VGSGAACYAAERVVMEDGILGEGGGGHHCRRSGSKSRHAADWDGLEVTTTADVFGETRGLGDVLDQRRSPTSAPEASEGMW